MGKRRSERKFWYLEGAIGRLIEQFPPEEALLGAILVQALVDGDERFLKSEEAEFICGLLHINHDEFLRLAKNNKGG